MSHTDAYSAVSPSTAERGTNIFGSAGFHGFTAGILAGVLLWFFAPALREFVFLLAPDGGEAAIVAPTDSPERAARILATRQRHFAGLVPQRPYLVISTSDNRFRLMRGTEVLREGVVSTGSYVYLEAASGASWLFQTPRGVHFVLGKARNPVWTKPDWAFVEEGLPVPPPDAPERFEYGVLGDYALAIGDGYLIHGTLYQRLLGLPVTHGCIRMGDADLEVVYSTLRIGSLVYIY